MAVSPCIFCNIVAGESPSLPLYEDDDAVAFLDINPVTRGHSLVVPRRHVVGVLDEDAGAALAGLGPALAAVADRLVTRLDADGVNLFSSTGEAAGQVVFHLHVHVLPRVAGDGLVRLATLPRAREDDLTATHRLLTD
jgi:histidine triad (HIT) family protein